MQRRPVLTGRWQFDQAADPGANSVARGPAMTLGGGAKQVPGAGFLGEGGLVLDGKQQDYASSAVPFDTSESFTLTAWVQAASVPSRPSALASAEGTAASSFGVGFVPNPKDPVAEGFWELAIPRTDTTDAGLDWAGNAQSFNSVTDWNHIAIVYDGFAKQARLYVNGQLGEAACIDGNDDGKADNTACVEAVPWVEDLISFEALKALQLGRAKGPWVLPGLLARSDRRRVDVPGRPQRRTDQPDLQRVGRPADRSAQRARRRLTAGRAGHRTSCTDRTFSRR